MRTNSRSDPRDGRVAFLWDESFLWGVMAYKALQAAGLPFGFVRAEDIRNGILADYQALFVPGGWASNKAKALSTEGIHAVRKFVDEGGNYIGFCGGAGLATQDGIGLVPVKRRPTKERVPSFSGRIRLSLPASPLWNGINEPVFHAWWPSQFVVDNTVNVLATFGEALPDAFTSDVNVGDGTSTGSWKDLEAVYQINLDPKRLIGEPAIIEGTYGKGKVLLSLVHFDTPGDGNGAAVLERIWKNLGCLRDEPDESGRRMQRDRDSRSVLNNDVLDMQQELDGLIRLGLRNYLWFWRNPLLLQWRRGVRGLEYCTLSVMMNELSALLASRAGSSTSQDVTRHILRIRTLVRPFTEKAGELLVRERFAMQNEHLTYERCSDPRILSLRDELFARSKSYGGAFKELIDEMDDALYRMLTDRA